MDRKPFKPYRTPEKSLESTMAETARKLGAVAYANGMPPKGNPYESLFMWTAWRDGYEEAKAKQHNERAGLL